jgi:hypothetical protein
MQQQEKMPAEVASQLLNMQTAGDHSQTGGH